MRRTRLSVILLALSVAGCASPTDLPLDRATPVPIHDRVEISGAPFALRFAGVSQDGRCPSGAMCIWAGDAVLQVDLVAPGDSVRAALHTNNAAGPASVTFHAHVVRLVSLEPYPEIGKPIDPGSYVATLLVSRS